MVEAGITWQQDALALTITADCVAVSSTKIGTEGTIALTLQAKDADGTNLPRIVTFKIIHPNSTVTSTNSNASAGLTVLTEAGSHTIVTWWGTHLVNSSLTISVASGTTQNIITKIRRLDSSNYYLLFSLNNTALTSPTIVGEADWQMLAVTATGTIPFKMDNANWKRSDEPNTFTIGTAQYTKGTGSWAFSSNIFSFNIIFSINDLSMGWTISSGGGGGGGGGGYIQPEEIPPVVPKLPDSQKPFKFHLLLLNLLSTSEQ